MKQTNVNRFNKLYERYLKLLKLQLLAKWSRCAWKVLKAYLGQGSASNAAVPERP